MRARVSASATVVRARASTTACEHMRYMRGRMRAAHASVRWVRTRSVREYVTGEGHGRKHDIGADEGRRGG